MTPAAQYAAAIEILDTVINGTPVEPACLAWTRSHRFAGSKDRAAIRDIVFSAERRRRSCAAMGGELSGRGIIRGYLAQQSIDEANIFGVDQYAPTVSAEDAPLSAWDTLAPDAQADLQSWMWKRLQQDHGKTAAAIAAALRHRAPVWVRVNTAKAEPAGALDVLDAAGFEPVQDKELLTAIQLKSPTRQLAQHPLMLDGSIELQDLGPQRALALVKIEPGTRVLDYCAGGGGKSLEFASRGAKVTAHDANPERMKDLASRAKKAGVKIAIAGELKGEKFDVVVCDVPCSGSGAFRRVTNGKWTLAEKDLESYVQQQRQILQKAMQHVAPGGRLIYMTCSLFNAENTEQSSWLASHMRLDFCRGFTPLDGCDGFFVAGFSVPVNG